MGTLPERHARPTRWATLRSGRSRAGSAALVFLVRERGVVVSMTCGSGQCTEPAQLVKLAKLVESRLPELPAGAAAPGAAAEPAAEPRGNPAVKPTPAPEDRP